MSPSFTLRTEVQRVWIPANMESQCLTTKPASVRARWRHFGYKIAVATKLPEGQRLGAFTPGPQRSKGRTHAH